MEAEISTVSAAVSWLVGGLVLVAVIAAAVIFDKLIDCSRDPTEALNGLFEKRRK